MPDLLRLKNFKSIKELELPLKPLTLLAGLNGSGKSSILQAIALTKQTLDQEDPSPKLLLRGEYVRLGRSEDVHFENAQDAELEIALRHADVFTSLKSTATHGLDELPLRLEGNSAALKHALNAWFQFIQADRLTPATRYEQATTRDRQRGWLGCQGQFTVDFLKQNEDQQVSGWRVFDSSSAAHISASLLKQVSPTTRLLDQTAAWLQELSPGVRLRPGDLDIADLSTLRFQYTGSNLDSESRDHRPTHVGFGLTYSLPIVVACLAAPAGSLMLLENPEAHLHPRGQAALGRLLARASRDGVQIIVETHSDHVLNGIRVAVKKRAIEAHNVALHYFERAIESGITTVDSPRLLPDGQLDRWPQGFFDQWDRSLDDLLE